MKGMVDLCPSDCDDFDVNVTVATRKDRKDRYGNVLPVGILWKEGRQRYSVETARGWKVAHTIEEARSMKVLFEEHKLSDPSWKPRWASQKYKNVRNKNARGPKARAARKAWLDTASGKASIRKTNRKQIENGNKLKHNKTLKGRATQGRAYRKKVSDPGKRLQAAIGCRLSTSLRKEPTDSIRLTKWTQFTGAADIQNHFRSTFDSEWMTWENYGPYRIDGPRTWDIGHRIPLSMYGTSKEDMLRCWSKANLFAQCAKENNEQRDRMPPRIVLLSLREVWPLSWLGIMPTVAV